MVQHTPTPSLSRVGKSHRAFVVEQLEPRTLLSSLNPGGREIGLAPGPVDSVVVVDLDGDGARDLVYTSGRDLYLQRGRGGGAFDTPALLRRFNLDAGHLAVGDLNADGRLDIALAEPGQASRQSTFLRVLFGSPDGFGPTLTSRTTARPQSLTYFASPVGPRLLLGGESRLDLLSADQGAQLQFRGTLFTGDRLSPPTVRQLDRAGDVEVLIAAASSAQLAAQLFVLNLTASSDVPVLPPPQAELVPILRATVDLGAGIPTSIAVAELTGDTMRDILVTIVDNTDASLTPGSIAGYTGRTLLAAQFMPEVTLPVEPPHLHFRSPVTIHTRTWDPGGFVRRPFSPTYEIASVGDINGDRQPDIALSAIETRTNGQTGTFRFADLLQLYRSGDSWGIAARTHTLTSQDPMGLPPGDRQPIVFVMADVRRVGRPDLFTFNGPQPLGPVSVAVYFNTNAPKAPIIESIGVTPAGPNVLFLVGSQIGVDVSLFVPDFASGPGLSSVRVYLDTNRNGRRDAGDVLIGSAEPLLTAALGDALVALDPSRSNWALQTIVSESWGLGRWSVLVEAVDDRGVRAVGVGPEITIAQVTTFAADAPLTLV